MGAVTFRYCYVFHDTNYPCYDACLTSRCGWTERKPPDVLVVWSTDGCITEALKAVV